MVQPGSAGTANLTFSGQVAPRAGLHFFAADAMAVHFGPEAGFRLRVANRSGQAERLKLDLAAPGRKHRFRLVGFQPLLPSGAQTEFLMIVDTGAASGEQRLRVCLERQRADGGSGQRECLALRTRAAR